MIFQILILLLMFAVGFSLMGTLFWFLFKRNAPGYDEIKN